VPTITHNRAFPYENDKFDILVGTFDEDDRGDEDDATYGFDDKQDGRDVLSVHFDGTDGNDQVFGGPNDDTIKGGKGLDALYGEGGNDWIYGGADRDWLFGGDDRDHLFGEGGLDEMYGDSGDDELYGGELSDLLDGGPGIDILAGGRDADWLTGGSEPDRFLFIYGNGFDNDSSSSNPDLIMDFNWKESDIIVVEGSEQDPSPDNYVEATIGYGAGYDDAKERAESLLLNSDKANAFVTDGVDGYLFVDAQSGGPVSDAAIEMGIILVGLTSESDFAWTNVWTSMSGL
jgi:Ca2+-binding RTX toxin-like protein